MKRRWSLGFWVVVLSVLILNGCGSVPGLSPRVQTALEDAGMDQCLELVRVENITTYNRRWTYHRAVISLQDQEGYVHTFEQDFEDISFYPDADLEAPEIEITSWIFISNKSFLHSLENGLEEHSLGSFLSYNVGNVIIYGIGPGENYPPGLSRQYMPQFFVAR